MEIKDALLSARDFMRFSLDPKTARWEHRKLDRKRMGESGDKDIIIRKNGAALNKSDISADAIFYGDCSDPRWLI